MANRGPDGEWIIRKASGHGLGHITAPSYDETRAAHSSGRAVPNHADETSPLWFGVKGEWDHGELSKCQAPKLVCDLWRIAFEAADRTPAGGSDLIREQTFKTLSLIALDKFPGLDKPQFLQRSLASRSDWAEYDRLPNRRAFMFFSTLPAPSWSNAWHNTRTRGMIAAIMKCSR